MITDKERAEIKALHAKVDALEAAGLFAQAEGVIAKNPLAFDRYTVRNGIVHYCGPVANENGWTP